MKLLRRKVKMTIREKVLIALYTKLLIIVPIYFISGLVIAFSNPALTTTQIHIVMFKWIVSFVLE